MKATKKAVSKTAKKAPAKKAPAKKAGKEGKASTPTKGIEEEAPAPRINSKGKEDPTGGKGRPSAFAGLRLYTVPESYPGLANPRREGTIGFASFEILKGLGSGKASYEAYIKAGGRRKDLAWDIERGYVIASDSKPKAKDIETAKGLSPKLKGEEEESA